MKNTVWLSEISTEGAGRAEATKNFRTFKGKILIADDAADNRELLKFILRKTSLELTLVEDGKAAVEAALAETFDLILLDMQMPVMDGYTAARKIRKSGITIPIVAFTANAMKHDIATCLEAGCSMHLPKPVTKSALFHCLETYLATDPAELLNVEILFSETLGNDPEEKELIASFFQGLTIRMEELSRAIPLNDFSTIAQLAHKIAGSAGLYGYPGLSDVASDLQKSAKKHDIESCKKHYSQMTTTSEAILQGIRYMKNEQLNESESSKHD